jgi:polysaccharide pyruvyl transferase WcaK-like protein
MKQVVIGLLWHSLSSGNLGVGALTESNIAIIRGVAERIGYRVRFVVLGTGDRAPPELQDELCAAGHSLEAYRAHTFRRSFRDHIRKCDFVVDIGEGDSFSDIYGFKRFFFYWLSKNMVCIMGKPLILAPQTIGPFNGWVAQLLARQVMACCTRVFARDNLSSNYLKYLGVMSNADEAIDVAFRLPYRKTERGPGNKTRVGINVSGLLLNGGYTGSNQFGLTIDYANTIRQVVAYFVTMTDVEVHLISHVIEPNMPVEDDVAAAQQLAQSCPGAIVAPLFTRPSEAKTYIASMDFFIGARMHACIAAFSSGVPVVPMAYSRKFNGLFGTLGFAWVADCRTDDSNAVLTKIIGAYQSRAMIANEIEVCLRSVSQRLEKYEQAIRLEIDS